MLLSVIGNDIYHDGNGIAAIEGTGGTAENFYTLHVIHADAAPTVVATHALAVDKYLNVVVAHAIEIYERAHAVGVCRNVGRESG